MKSLLDFLKGKWLAHPLHPILAYVPMGDVARPATDKKS
jgi:hypothetical protein